MIWAAIAVPLPLSFGVVILGFDGWRLSRGTELDHFAAGIIAHRERLHELLQVRIGGTV
jgi:hypothetical protein